MKVYAIVGMAGSGKSILASHFQSRGLPVIRFGQFIVNEVIKRGMTVTPDNERAVREELRRLHGMDVCAQLALGNIREYVQAGQNVAIDGLYSFSEYKTLRATLGGTLVVIAAFTPKNLRYERLTHRLERSLTPQQAEDRDIAEIENIEKGGPIALADFTLVNDGTVDQFITTANALIDQT